MKMVADKPAENRALADVVGNGSRQCQRTHS